MPNNTNNSYQKINAVEGLTIEFKTSLLFLARTSSLSEEQLDVITRTIASLMNQDGGTLYIGVDDAGYATNSVLDEFCYLNLFPPFQGYSYPSNQDGYKRFLLDWVGKNLGAFATSLLSMVFQKLGDVTICVVNVKKSKVPVWFKRTELYVRADASTRQLRGTDINAFFMQMDVDELRKALVGEEASFQQRLSNIKANEAPNHSILVVYPNGDYIHEKKNVDTMLEVIHRAGIEEVRALGLTGRAGKGNTPYVPFIGTEVYLDNLVNPTKTQRKLDGYMVFTKYGKGDIQTKLNQISQGLGLKLHVEEY